MFVMTIDQEDSRRAKDLVPAAVSSLARAVDHPVLPFERTVGDEIQVVLAGGDDVVTACRELGRTGDWHIGIGIGGVEEPLPASTREARGEAFIAAREAVETVKPRRPSLRVLGAEGTSPEAVADADAALRLLAALWSRRSAAGRQAVDEAERLRGEDGRIPMARVAAELGISHQALSQRLRTAAWELERDALVTVARLLDRSDARGRA